jgi:hypothetical protein
LGADLGQGANNVCAIAADEIVAEAFGSTGAIHKDSNAVPCSGRMGKPEERPSRAYVKAYNMVVVDRAIDGEDRRVAADKYAGSKTHTR